MQKLGRSILALLATSNLCSYVSAETTQVMPLEYIKIKTVVSRIAATNNLGKNPLLFTVVPGAYASKIAESLRLCEKDNCNYYGQINPYKLYSPQINEILRQSFLYGDINAWAHPQGTIELTLQAVRIFGTNEEYLACTLAHELSHVTKHSSYEQSKEISLRTPTPSINDEAKKLIEAAVARDHELKSDKDAFIMTVRAGYAKDACILGLEFLHRASGDGSSTEPTSTHPGVEDRISALKTYSDTPDSQLEIDKVEKTHGVWEYNPNMNFLKFSPAH